MATLTYRSLAAWALGYPTAAVADAERALRNAREIGHAASLIFALIITSTTRINCADYTATKAQFDEAVALAGEKGASFWKVAGTVLRCLLALTGKATDAVQMITSGIAAFRANWSKIFLPFFLLHLIRAYAELGQFDDAWRCIDEAMAAVETNKETWCEADILRIAGEIRTSSAPERDAAKAREYFERALAIARQQQQNPGNSAQQ